MAPFLVQLVMSLKKLFTTTATIAALLAGVGLVTLADTRPVAAAALDPNIPMYTLETPHFRVNYPEGYDRIAQKAAQYAEEAHEKISQYFGVAPKNKTEFTLFDHEDTVNGLALPYVNNAMYIYLTSPDSDLMWGRYDDWLKLVVIHEYCHVLHFETVDGLPKVLNDIFGRVLFPNLFQPTFLIEGLAVILESMYTSEGKGGRLHDGNYDMLLRADVLANRQLSIDQAGGYYLTDFPGGDSPYVYGTFFYQYIIDTYGADKPPAIAREYSKAPWLGIDHAVKQVIPGRDAQQLWDELLHHLRTRAHAQLAEIRKKPVTVTTPVTDTGMNHRHPGFLPNGNLIYIEGLRHGPTQLVERVGTDKSGKPITRPIMNRGHYGDYDISRDGRYMYYQSSHGQNNYSSFDDIFRMDLQTGEKKNLTHFARTNNPGVSPNGELIIGVVNGRGQNNLRLFDKNGKVLKRLTELEDNTQFTAPRWSPDGKRIVMSAWRGASRDLYMLDTANWLVRPLWKDDAVDVGPVWTPDGKYVIFASDRENRVFNIYAYQPDTGELFQVTNVLTGAVEPAISPDGKTIAVALCTKNGFDIHTLAFDPSTWIKVDSPIFDKSIKPYEFVQKQTYPSHPYNPLPSLMPKFWSPIYLSNPGVLGAFTIGYDVLLTNTLFGLGGYSVFQPGGGVPAGTSISPLDLSFHTFLYQNSQWDTNVSVTSSGFANRSPIPLTDGSTLELWQRFDTNSLSFSWNNLPSPLTNASFQTGDQLTVGLNVRSIRDMTPSAANAEAVTAKLLPQAGRSHSVSVTYKANTAGKYGYSSAPEYGGMTTYGAELAHPAMLSETEYYRFFADWRNYMNLGVPHHTLGFRGMLGLNLGRPQGDFYLGGARSVNMAGTPDIRVAADPEDVLVSLRGYPFASTTGNTVGMLSSEYRFPIMELQHGTGTLPLFAERLAGSVFLDTGTAFNNSWGSFIGQTPDATAKLYPVLGDFRAGVGAELRLNFKIANNPLNTVPLATIARMAMNQLNAFNDSSGILRLGIAQPVLPLTGPTGTQTWLGPTFYTEFGTVF